MTQVMGILNVTPDSFSDGGHFNTLESALLRAREMVGEGADIIDVGGESTRPGAVDVSIQEELDRVIPVIEKLKAECTTQISIDTSKAEIMEAALHTGVDMINDVNALQASNTLEICAQSTAKICLMHRQGKPRSMQQAPLYTDVVKEVSDFLGQRIKACVAAGIDTRRLILDPGFGFGKTLDHNLELLANLSAFKSFGLPLLVGISRKAMVGALLENSPVEKRLAGSLSAAVIAATKGSDIIRVHDVKQTVEALKILDGVKRFE